MLTKRIIPCLDVKDGKVVKGVKFRNHQVMGDIVELAEKYSAAGADELVFYDITASAEQRATDVSWIEKIASVINIPFCVAGGIRSVDSAERVLNAGADKISINSPALENPRLISELADRFGVQCVVVGADSMEKDGDYLIWQYTGKESSASEAGRRTLDWIKEAESLGAGEIVLNCMNADGTREGYDIKQLRAAREILSIPIIASGGAGKMEHFSTVFEKANVDGALAASVFHKNEFSVDELKRYLIAQGSSIRPT